MNKTVTFLAILFLFTLKSPAQTFQLKDSTFNKGDVLITYAIIFEYNSKKMYPESSLFLDSLVSFLIKNEELKIHIGVHEDERGTPAYSRCNSCNRAPVIERYLINNGIHKNRLNSKGYKGRQPIIKGAKTEDEHRINRRTEFTILP